MQQEVQVDLNVTIDQDIDDLENVLKKGINSNLFNLAFMGLNLIGKGSIKLSLSVDATLSKSTISKDINHVFDEVLSKQGIKLNKIDLILEEAEIYQNY